MGTNWRVAFAIPQILCLADGWFRTKMEGKLTKIPNRYIYVYIYKHTQVKQTQQSSIERTYGDSEELRHHYALSRAQTFVSSFAFDVIVCPPPAYPVYFFSLSSIYCLLYFSRPLHMSERFICWEFISAFVKVSKQQVERPGYLFAWDRNRRWHKETVLREPVIADSYCCNLWNKKALVAVVVVGRWANLGTASQVKSRPAKSFP